MKKIQKIFAWISILSLILQVSNGLLFARPAFAEEEVPPETTVEETTPEEVSPPAEEPAGEPEVEPQPEADPPLEETPTIEVTPTETPEEPSTEPNLEVQGLAEEGPDLGPEGTDTPSAQLKPSISTDKEDYAPEETVTITGENFPANSVLLIKVTRPDGSVVKGDGSFEEGSDEITTDGEGRFTYLYQLDGIQGEYLVEVFQGGTVLATLSFTDSVDKVTICHATSSHSNPYNVQEPNKSGDVSGHDGHNGPIWYPGITVPWGDIIPPFDYDGGSYPGKNWPEGQAILDNNCEIPSQEPFCGDGNLDEGEECDYGENNGQSACSFDCTLDWPEEPCEEPEEVDPIDTIDLGNSSSETAHNASDWGADPGSGNYGGRDGGQDFSLVVGNFECNENGRSASFTLDAGTNYANKLRIRHLDGLSNLDSFDVYVNGSFWAHYTDLQDSAEVWYTHEYPLPNLQGVINVEIRLTDQIWSGCPSWGQLAINWVEIAGYECEGVCVEGVLWMIGDKETGQMDNPVDELNWPGSFGVFPAFPDPFVVGTNSDGEFPWNSNYNQGYATDFDVDFNYAGADAAVAQLTVGWSPGKSANEQKEVFLDTLSLGTTPVRLGVPVAGWWEQMERFEDTFTFPLTHGSHTLNFKHLFGDGTLWDFVKLEIISCEPEPELSQVTVCKYDGNENPLAGWRIALKGEHIEDVSVPSDGSSVLSSSIGANDYVLEPVGTYTYWPAQLPEAGIADAGYSLRPEGSYNPGPGPQWISGDALGIPWVGFLEVQVNDTNVDWGYLTADHRYALGLSHTGGAISFRILDSYYGDNSGSIPVGIYQGWVGVTDENGCVTFSDVPYGQYTLEELIMANWEQISGPENPITVNESVENFAFFNREMYGSISGIKYEDKNGNGYRDVGDDALSGWTINLWNGASVIDPSLPADQTTVTAGDGSYSFEDLPWGDYTVCEEDRVGWEQTVPGGGTCYYLTVGGNIKPADDIDFGNFELGYIQGRKYEDLNQNGTRQAGEAWLSGWTINLYDDDWNFIASTTTAGGNGIYRFEDLGIGTYYACEVLQEGWTQTGPILGGNRVANQSPNSADEGEVCWRSVFNKSGQSRTGRQFGNVHYGSIRACKYDDYNGSGSLDVGEPGIEGVTMTLKEWVCGRFEIFCGGWVEEATCDTEEDGCCTFEGLEAGNYRVSEDLNDLPGYTPTSDPQVELMLAPGQETLVNFFNQLAEIGLDLTKSNSVSGSTVTYTLTVHNDSEATAHNVYVKDLLPSGFTYNTGTTEFNGASASDPTITGHLLTWSLGDLDPDQTIIITYDVSIGSLQSGFYPNIAFVWGANRDPCDPGFCSHAYSDFAYSLVWIPRGVSATTAIGGVLGVTTEEVLGAATGSETYWLVLALIMVLAGLTIMFMNKKRRALLVEKLNKLGKKLSLLATIILALFVFAGSVWAIDSLYIRVADLPEYMPADNFKLYYTALERENKPISVVCYVEKDGGFGWKTFGGTQTDPAGSCEVFGHELDGDGTYRFKATATSADGSTESNVTQTIIDRSAPSAPGDYRKSRESSTSYKIHFKNPGDDDYAFTRIFASTEQNFTADDATKKADVGGGPDQEFDHLVTGLEPNQEYYFALQGFDKAGNGSGLTGDGGSVTYEETIVEVTPTPGGEVVVLPMGEAQEGEILGEEEQPAEEGAAEEVPGLIGGAATQIAQTNRGLILAGGGVVLVLAALGYYFYRKRIG